MDPNPYAAFLAPQRQFVASLEPEESWWSWRGHEVHIARASRPEAAARVLVVHGAGGHSAALWPLAALLADQGLDLAAVDLPLYGRTVTHDPGAVRYGDWIHLLVDLIAAEEDGRPLIMLGASIGGLLAYEAAAQSQGVAAVAATCLLDPSDWRARAHMTRFGILGVFGRPLSVLARGRLVRTMIPMTWIANFLQMSRDRALSRLCATDPRGGGARVPLGFLASYMNYPHTLPEMMTTPVTLVHPSHDEWTPIELSIRFLRRIAAPTRAIILRECGHFPIEEPGFADIIDAIQEIARGLVTGHHGDK